MSVRNLESLFLPRSVALIGASPQEDSVGRVTARNLLAGGFAGPIWFVNPNRQEVLGHPCHPDVASLPEAPDLVVTDTPPEHGPQLKHAPRPKESSEGKEGIRTE